MDLTKQERKVLILHYLDQLKKKALTEILYEERSSDYETTVGYW